MKARTSSGFPSNYKVVPERLVSAYDPFLATVKQAHPTHARLWTCTAKLGVYLQLKCQQLLSHSQIPFIFLADINPHGT